MRARAALAAVLATLAAIGATGCANTDPMPTTSQAMPSAGDRDWSPRPGLRWQIQLSGPFVEAIGVNVYDLDPYQVAAETVAGLRAKGRATICHLDVGVSDTSLPDAARIPSPVLGAPAGEGRRWLDIRQWSALEPVLADRMRLCARKGFGAVDADATFGYAYRSGFDLDADDQITFDTRVADLAHQLGLKAGVRAGPSLAARVEPHTDFAVTGNCFASSDCSAYAVFVKAGKAVFDIETVASGDFCPLARAYGYAATRAGARLDGVAEPC
jgi:hypothetical protein